MSDHPTSKVPIGGVPPKLDGFLCPYCLMEIKKSDDLQNFMFPTPARGVGVMFVTHRLCHKPIPFQVLPMPPVNVEGN
jgi:hypothetical protein